MHTRYAALLAALVLSLSACADADEPTTPTTPDLAAADRAAAGADAAAAFAAFAEGADSEVPWADLVHYSVHGVQVAEFDAAFARRRDTWDGCAQGDTTYEGRDCPVSPLATIARLDEPGSEPVVEDRAPTTVGCSSALPAPQVEATAVAWVRPAPELRDCFNDFAVTIYFDDGDRVNAVDLLLSGPKVPRDEFGQRQRGPGGDRRCRGRSGACREAPGVA